MSDRGFTYPKVDGEPSGLVPLDKLLEAAGKRVTRGDGPFSVTVNGDTIRDDVKRRAALEVFERNVRMGKVGDTVRIRAAKGVLFSSREGKPANEIIDTSGNKKADAYWTGLKAEFPNVTFLGSYVCKANSQHRFGNAVDGGFSSKHMGKEMFDWAIAHHAKYDLRNIIVQQTWWHLGTIAPYTGTPHVTHTHGDFNPMFATSLPCGVLPKGQG